MFSLWQQKRLNDQGWDNKSPKLILRKHSVSLHITQGKTVQAKKIKESKLDPNLVTVGVDLNVKNLAVIIVRRQGKIIKRYLLPTRDLISTGIGTGELFPGTSGSPESRSRVSVLMLIFGRIFRGSRMLAASRSSANGENSLSIHVKWWSYV